MERIRGLMNGIEFEGEIEEMEGSVGLKNICRNQEGYNIREIYLIPSSNWRAEGDD